MKKKKRDAQATSNFSNSKTAVLTKEAKFFLESHTPKQRQYEALRAYYVENMSGQDIATQFGYTINAFRILCHQFKHNKDRQFFIESKPGPKYSPKRDRSRDRIIALRKQNYSVQDIQRLLSEEKIEISSGSIWIILQEEGFSKLPRRKDEERPEFPRPDKARYADIRQLSWHERTIETRFGGIFLLMKILTDLKIHEIPKSLKWYGSKMIPIENGFLSCLLLKLINKERKSHVMDIVFDEGIALSVGLNEVPKTAYICEYSERITHRDTLNFMNNWIRRLNKLKVIGGESFNLDFQSLPYYGEASVIEKHYVSMRSRRQKAILVFFAQDVDSKIFCYSNADLRKGEESDEIFRFIDFWKKQSGKNPPHLVFDSKVTTYSNLSKLNKTKITFVTLRRRTPSVLKDVANVPASAWRTITLSNVERKYKTPKVIDRNINLADYEGSIRQIFVKDLGHDLPTIIITNDTKTSCSELISRYALRMLIENNISACVNFFHTTSLSSSVAMRIDLDVLLTLIGQSVYHILSKKLRGYENATPDVIFRKFIDTPAKIYVRDQEVEVCLNKRSDNPILLHAGILNQTFKLPWVGNKTFRITLK